MTENQNKFEYNCQNPSCQYSSTKGYKILLSLPNLVRCPYCGQMTLKRTVSTPSPGARPVAGAGGGALLGWAIGGPPGAIIGGLLGLLAGAASEENDRHVGPKK